MRMENQHVNYCEHLYEDVINFKSNVRSEYAKAIQKYANELLNKIEILTCTKTIIKKSNFNKEYNKKVQELIEFKITENDFENFLKSSLIKVDTE